MVSRSNERSSGAAEKHKYVAAMVEEVLGCKWTVRILDLLAMRPHRPSEIQRLCAGLSAKVMNERLAKLMHFGIVIRRDFGDKPPVRVEYSLTEFGERFAGIITDLRALEHSLPGNTRTDTPSTRSTPSAPRHGTAH